MLRALEVLQLPIDNDVYNRMGEGWWEEENPLNVLHGSITPGRFAYFRVILTDRLGLDLGDLRALDIGCGGGFLAEEFARLGCQVVGVDPSEVSIETARRHAATTALDVDYRLGYGERLPVADGEFDLACCCDVLEHVADLDAVISETARALKPNGIFLFDTINRTLASKLLAIKVMQEWRSTRIIDSAIHEWAMFIKPKELVVILGRHGLRIGEIVGLGPRSRKPLVLLSFMRANRGRISYGELSRRLDAGQVKNTSLSYMGFATKTEGIRG
ncbi:MAG: bifunctional 2-polyprenyl-6-hydroxyphenol methylase/3-demethylubiquinol 3-O-methyltransferase UbiG [Nocardioidaceae bacterium]